MVDGPRMSISVVFEESVSVSMAMNNDLEMSLLLGLV